MSNAYSKEYFDMLIEMLVYIDSFCKEHNIEYCIFYGTALGAVRHGGFIPWDDDIDIGMHIDEYKKFRKVWKEFGDNETYFLQDKISDPYLNYVFPRLRKNNTTSMTGHRDVPMHRGLAIDIFPFYNAPDNQFLLKIMKKIMTFNDNVSRFAYNKPKSNKCKIGFYYFLSLFSLGLLELFSGFSKKGKSVLLSMTRGNKTVNKIDIFPINTISFAGKVFNSPNNAQKYLEIVYGDYMTLPPEEDRRFHPKDILDLHKDYSFYTGYDAVNKKYIKY